MGHAQAFCPLGARRQRPEQPPLLGAQGLRPRKKEKVKLEIKVKQFVSFNFPESLYAFSSKGSF